ncbi:MAG: endonuclease/exonuclease/phosphatase family protein [Actinobacteria bacterium]|nr:endonuclease/exonuclease/phosphatase family protein [Actinomycetota bacterium]
MFDTTESGRSLKILLGALVFTMGAQSMRFLFGSITWYLRDTLGIGTLDLVPIALAPFLLAILFPVLSRWLTVRGAVWTGVWVLVLTRAYLQVSESPAIDFWMSAVGTMAFVGLLPLLASMGRATLVGGVLLGLAVDGAIKGMGLSLDLAHQEGPGAIAVVLALGVGTLYVLWACPAAERQGVLWGPGWTLLGFGPFLFFQALILQSQGWVSEVAGIAGPQAQLRIALLNVVTLLVVPRLERFRAAQVAALVVFVSTVALATGPALIFNIVSILAVPAAGLLWAAMVPDVYEGGVSASATYLIGGATLFVVLGLLYYVSLDLRLGFDQAQVRVGAVVVVALIALGAVVSGRSSRPGVASQTWTFAALACVLPLLGLLGAGGGEEAGSSSAVYPLRVMTYNIHSGYDIEGVFDLEELARVIEDSGAVVVGLQEVARGQLITGVTDQLTILKERLGFPHSAFFGTSDPVWGNAVLSRVPILGVDTAYLPQEGTPLRRGYLGVTLEMERGELLFISTHLQHVNDSERHELDPEADLLPVHRAQIEAILTEWGGAEPAVLVGDFNARPDWSQIADLKAAGWVDVWEVAGQGDGLTSSSADPKYRIDYVFHTPDLTSVDAGVIQSPASDHFPVVAEVAPG